MLFSSRYVAPARGEPTPRCRAPGAKRNRTQRRSYAISDAAPHRRYVRRRCNRYAIKKAGYCASGRTIRDQSLSALLANASRRDLGDLLSNSAQKSIRHGALPATFCAWRGEPMAQRQRNAGVRRDWPGSCHHAFGAMTSIAQLANGRLDESEEHWQSAGACRRHGGGRCRISVRCYGPRRAMAARRGRRCAHRRSRGRAASRRR
jgi:hypothetical protein